MVKRVLDLSLGLFALIIFLPLMVLSAIFVFIEDGSPVIIRQWRVGKHGQLFPMFKIRTMVRDADPRRVRNNQTDGNRHPIYKTRNDQRVTRVGRVLRRFSLDELPQLFNVIAGTMSMVGPRPELPDLAQAYEQWQCKRFDVLPGITGWWQIHHRGDQPMSLHIEDDLYYIQNYSLGLDIQIIVRTIWVVLTGKGSY